MLVSVALLLAGAVINATGIRNPGAQGRRGGPGGEQPPADAAGAAGPLRAAAGSGEAERSPPEPTGPAREA
jgi:hypothetical protein